MLVASPSLFTFYRHQIRMEFIILATAHFMALITPGPDFFLIMQTALRMRLKYAWAVCAGIATANGLYISIAVLGLEYVRTMHHLMQALHYAGGMYLLYIAVLLLKAPMRTIDVKETNNILRLRDSKKQFLIGLTSGILNPKNIIFYLSLFTAMVSPATPLYRRSLYGVWMAGMVLGWDMMVALVINRRRRVDLSEIRLFRMEKIAGLALAGFGIALFLH